MQSLTRLNCTFRSFLMLAVLTVVFATTGFSTQKEKLITITVTNNGGGMIQPVSSPRPSEILEAPYDAFLREGTYVDTLDEGSNRFYAVVPCPDYRIDSLFIDDTLTEFPRHNPMLGISQYRWPIWEFRDLSASHTLRVKFRRISELTISAMATEGGSITPQGNIVLETGAQQSFTMKPTPGYRLVRVIVDSQSMDPSVSYTFTNVTASHSIEAVFEKSEN